MDENEISFCTTALSRPDIIDQTYKSFTKNIKNLDLSSCILYINIDPIPNDEKLQQETLEVAKKYFNNVIHRIPNEPNFTVAINYCWESAETPYIFHLEDDWVLTKEIDINEVMRFFGNSNKLEVIFRAYSYKYTKLVLSPSIWKYDLYKIFAGNLKTSLNPEVQLRDKRFADFFNQDSIVAIGNKPIIKDIGREWLFSKNLKKPVKNKFVRY
jgi:hypothetical protein